LTRTEDEMNRNVGEFQSLLTRGAGRRGLRRAVAAPTRTRFRARPRAPCASAAPARPPPPREPGSGSADGLPVLPAPPPPPTPAAAAAATRGRVARWPADASPPRPAQLGWPPPTPAINRPWTSTISPLKIPYNRGGVSEGHTHTHTHIEREGGRGGRQRDRQHRRPVERPHTASLRVSGSAATCSRTLHTFPSSTGSSPPQRTRQVPRRAMPSCARNSRRTCTHARAHASPTPAGMSTHTAGGTRPPQQPASQPATRAARTHAPAQTSARGRQGRRPGSPASAARSLAPPPPCAPDQLSSATPPRLVVLAKG
jgi:hypothetical protein